MDAQDFYRLAEQLNGDNKCEATYREIISLCYYACFHLVTPIAENRISQPANTGMHKQLCLGLIDYGEYNPDKLAKPIARKFYSLGLKLNNARKKRTDASYRLHVNIEQKAAKAQMQAAQSIMQLIKELQQDLATTP